MILATRHLLPCAVAACLLAAPPEAEAQRPERPWTATVAAGLALQPDDQSDHLAQWGQHLAAGVTVAVTPGVGLRIEALHTGFGSSSSHVHGPCFLDPDPEPFACHPPAGAVRVQGLTLGLTGRGASSAGYVALGGGGYRLSSHPLERGSARLGVYAGVGRLLGARLPRLELEAQLHWLPGLTYGGKWSAPVRLGLTF